jgi:hypothetical protein
MDWGSCRVDRKSISGYVFVLASGPIVWYLRAQTTMALFLPKASLVRKAKMIMLSLLYILSIIEEKVGKVNVGQLL